MRKQPPIASPYDIIERIAGGSLEQPHVLSGEAEFSWQWRAISWPLTARERKRQGLFSFALGRKGPTGAWLRCSWLLRCTLWPINLNPRRKLTVRWAFKWRKTPRPFTRSAHHTPDYRDPVLQFLVDATELT